MSLPSWPEGLPYMPMASGFSVSEPHVPSYETEFEGGAYRRRPRSTLRRALFRMSWLFDHEQRDAFRAFYHHTLIEGTMRFTMLVPDGTGGAYLSRTCQFKGGSGYQEAQPQPPHWTISAELYVFGNF